MEIIITAAITIGIGLLLCFRGLGFIRTSISLAGFALGYLIAQSVDPLNIIIWLVGGAIGAVAALIIVTMIRNFAERILGFIMGALIAVRLGAMLNLSEPALILGLAIAGGFIGALLMNWLGKRLLLWSTAFGGASIILYGIGTLLPFLSFLARPGGDVLATLVATGAWVILAIIGGITQRRMYRTTITRTVLRA